MASRLTTRAIRSLKYSKIAPVPTATRPTPRPSPPFRFHSSGVRPTAGDAAVGHFTVGDGTPGPPLLATIKNDMKAALKAKDKLRLDVLRGILAATTIRNKSSEPVETDSDMRNLVVRKFKSANEDAAHFQEAGRTDLAERAQAEAQVLNEYICDSQSGPTMGEEEIRVAVSKMVDEFRAEGMATKVFGRAMKQLKAPGGLIKEGRADPKLVARILKKVAAPPK